jgi:TPR repeat protein
MPEPLEERLAAVAPPLGHPIPEAAPIGDEIPSAAQLEPMVKRGVVPIETSPEAPADASAAEIKATPEQPPAVASTPSDPAPGLAGTDAAQSSSPSPAAVVAPPKKPVMSAAEIALMVDRGRVLFDAGDLAAARLFFRRAANAGDAAAALAMGATYDPDVLSKRFIRGIEADAQEARTWYERARELGSPEGPRRIEMLAHR